MADNPFEIPQALRDVSEQNLKQAHAEYEQLMDLVTKAMRRLDGRVSPQIRWPLSSRMCKAAPCNREGKCRVKFSHSPARSATHSPPKIL